MKRKKKTNSYSNRKELNKELETLFHFAPPKQMKKSLHEVYSVYLQNIENMDFKEVAADMYLLHQFIEKAEDLWKNEKTGK